MTGSKQISILMVEDNDGHAALIEMNLRELTRHDPIIVLTSTDDDLEINRCYELRCNVDLRKPVHLAQERILLWPSAYGVLKTTQAPN